jgi:hypothetical protein
VLLHQSWQQTPGWQAHQQAAAKELLCQQQQQQQPVASVLPSLLVQLLLLHCLSQRPLLQVTQQQRQPAWLQHPPAWLLLVGLAPQQQQVCLPAFAAWLAR